MIIKNNKPRSHGAVGELLIYINIIKKQHKKAKTKHVQNHHSGFPAIIINTTPT